MRAGRSASVVGSPPKNRHLGREAGQLSKLQENHARVANFGGAKGGQGCSSHTRAATFFSLQNVSLVTLRGFDLHLVSWIQKDLRGRPSCCKATRHDPPRKRCADPLISTPVSVCAEASHGSPGSFAEFFLRRPRGAAAGGIGVFATNHVDVSKHAELPARGSLDLLASLLSEFLD